MESTTTRGWAGTLPDMVKMECALATTARHALVPGCTCIARLERPGITAGGHLVYDAVRFDAPDNGTCQVCCKSSASIPQEVLEATRQCLGLDEDDESRDAEIATLTGKELFSQYLEWEGIIGYDEQLWDMVEELRRYQPRK